MNKTIYRLYEYPLNMLHWRISGASCMGALCGRGNFIDWDPARWPREGEVDYCQECDVKYVLEMMS